MKNKLMAVLLIIVLVLAAAGCATPTPPEDTPPPAPPPGPVSDSVWPVQNLTNVATLGEEYVPFVLYAYFFTLYHLNLEQNAMMTGHGGNMEAFWNLEQDGMTIKQLLLNESMRAAKEFSGFYRMAVAQGITEREEDAESAEEQIAILLEQMGGDQEMFAQTYRLSPEQMREAMRRVNVASAYLDQALGAIVVTEEALREIYDANPDAFDEVTVRHVLIDVRDITDDDERAEATALAEEILERINAGEEIGELAAIYSDDPGSRYSDGEYTFGMGVMVPEFEAWAFSASPGDTGIVLTQFGYHVMQLISRTSFEDLDTSVLEDAARDIIFEEEHHELYDLMASDDWVYDHDLLDLFAATVLPGNG